MFCPKLKKMSPFFLQPTHNNSSRDIGQYSWIVEHIKCATASVSYWWRYRPLLLSPREHHSHSLKTCNYRNAPQRRWDFFEIVCGLGGIGYEKCASSHWSTIGVHHPRPTAGSHWTTLHGSWNFNVIRCQCQHHPAQNEPVWLIYTPDIQRHKWRKSETASVRLHCQLPKYWLQGHHWTSNFTWCQVSNEIAFQSVLEILWAAQSIGRANSKPM